MALRGPLVVLPFPFVVVSIVLRSRTSLTALRHSMPTCGPLWSLVAPRGPLWPTVLPRGPPVVPGSLM